jgi:ribose-phosphate pyrophosphokinase
MVKILQRRKMILYNGINVIEKFPNGETRINTDLVWKSSKGSVNIISCKYESDADLMQLMLLKKHYDSRWIHNLCKLFIPYLPYSRMDRVEEGSAFTLKYVCELINSLNFTEVHVIEPHSDVSVALLDRIKVHFVTDKLFEYASNYWGFGEKDYIFLPDAGAKKRYNIFNTDRIIYGDKKRDFKTGKITSLNVIGDYTPGGIVYIIDDLCSYGGTFVLASDKLMGMGARAVILITAHMEDSYLEGSIPDDSFFIKVLSTDSIYSKGSDGKLTIYKASQLMEK